MADVSVRELRNHGGDVIDRVQAGERIIITRSGHPVAPLPSASNEMMPGPGRPVATSTVNASAKPDWNKVATTISR